MANTRLRKPLHNLTQAAFDLAKYLRHVEREEFFASLKVVRDKYAAPKESWIWFPFYSRDRVPVLDKALGDETTPVIEIATNIFKEGGWEDTSANTNLLRLLLKNLHGYDTEATLELNEIINLRELLFEAIEKRLVAEGKLSKEEARLNEIDDEKLQLERQLLKTQQELLRKQEEILDEETKLLELKETQNSTDSELRKIEAEKMAKVVELAAYEERLNAIQIERNKREEELDAARAKLLLLNPEIDISKMELKEIETLMTEAKLVGEEAARTYIKEVQEVRRRREELGNLKGNFSKVKKNLAGKAVYGAEVVVADPGSLSEEQARVIKEKETRTQEVKTLCNKRNKDSDRVVKSYMERFFKIQIAQRTSEEADTDVKVKKHASVENLYSEGERAVVVDKAALERAGKQRKPFSEMTLAKPKSTNAEFLQKMDHLRTQLTFRTAPEPRDQGLVAAKKIEKGKREQLERMLAYSPETSSSPAMTKAGDASSSATTETNNSKAARSASAPLITKVLAIKGKLGQPQISATELASLPALPSSPDFPLMSARGLPPAPPPPPKFGTAGQKRSPYPSVFAPGAQSAISAKTNESQADAVGAVLTTIKIRV